MSSLIINVITVFFVVIVLGYSIINIIRNKSLYAYINEEYKALEEHHQRSIFYNNLKNKYNEYLTEHNYGQINTTTFIEEICTGFSFKNKDILQNIKSIKNSSSTCILLGVLGTFVGLSLMLLTINTSDIINSLPMTISSMQTAFISSICGIVCSILLNILLGNNDCEQILTRLMLKCENLLTTELTHVKSQDIDYKIEDVKNTIKQISKSIESIERFDQISKDLHEFNNEFVGAIETLKDLLLGSQNSIQIFDQDVRKLDKQMNILNIKFSKLFDKYENQEDINKEILIDIKQTSKNIEQSTQNQEKIRSYIRNLSSSFSLYERCTQDLLEKLVTHEREITTIQSNLNDEQINIDDSVRHLASVIAISSQDIDQKLSLIFDYIDIYKEASTMEKMKEEDYNKMHEEEIYDIDRFDTLTKYKNRKEPKSSTDIIANSKQLIKTKKRYTNQENLKIKSTNKLKSPHSNYLLGDDKND